MICKRCVWFNNDEGKTCEAFPFGIPLEILEDKIKHTVKFPEQVGDFVFEKEPEIKGLIPDPFDMDDQIRLDD